MIFHLISENKASAFTHPQIPSIYIYKYEDAISQVMCGGGGKLKFNGIKYRNTSHIWKRN